MNLPTKYRWSCSAAVHLITMYLASAKDSLDEFVANDGFNLLIGNIRREVDFALEILNLVAGHQKMLLSIIRSL